MSRGILLLAVGRNKEAAKDLSLFCWLCKWTGKSCGYAALLNSYAFSSQGQKREANLAIAEAGSKLKAEERPAELLFFLGKLSEASLLANCSSDTSRSRARFYIALRAVLNGQKSKASEHLEWLKKFGDQKVEELDVLPHLTSVVRGMP